METTQFMVYLAGPIDDIGFAAADSWRYAVEKEFPNVLFFHPQRAYGNISKQTMYLADHMNRHAIRCSSGMLANLSGPGRGFGTIREIEYARSQSKRVVVVTDPADIGDHTLMTYDLDRADDPVSGMQKLLEWLTDAVNAPQQFPFPFGGFIVGEPPKEEE